MSDASKDEIVQCGCGWCGTRENAAHHRRTDPRHATSSKVEELEQALTLAKQRIQEPIDMLLFCLSCGLQHVDAPDERTPDWTNPPHKSHLCHGCGHIWRPCDRATNGVAAITTKGEKDGSPVPSKAAESRAVQAEEKLRLALDTLRRIAKPALGGKQQQWAAQQCLKAIEEGLGEKTR